MSKKKAFTIDPDDPLEPDDPIDFESWIREQIEEVNQYLADIQEFPGNKRDRRNHLIGNLNAYHEVLDVYLNRIDS